MLWRRALTAGLGVQICNHTFRATGITAYLSNKGTLEKAQQIAGHESPRTTKLYENYMIGRAMKFRWMRLSGF